VQSGHALLSNGNIRILMAAGGRRGSGFENRVLYGAAWPRLPFPGRAARRLHFRLQRLQAAFKAHFSVRMSQLSHRWKLIFYGCVGLITAPALEAAAQPPSPERRANREIQVQGAPDLSALERVTSARLDGLALPRPGADARSSKPRAFDVREVDVREVDVFARYAVWFDGGPIAGLRLQILPRDEAGELRAINGQVSVELFVKRSTDFAANGTAGGWRIERGASWSETISATQSTSRGIVLWLAYPEWLRQADSRVAPWGTVRVRILIAGESPLEYELDSVRLRPFSHLRDTQERQTGRRPK